MNINIYQKYKINIIKKWSELSEENETIYDNIFVKGDNKTTLIIDGGELLDRITQSLRDNYLSEFIIIDKKLCFEYFNYNTGENESICYEILEDIIEEGE